MDVTDVLGNFGKIQKRILAFCLLRSFTIAGLMYNIRFYSGSIEHWCSPPEQFWNLTAGDWKQCCLPKTDAGFSHCQHYQLEAEYVNNSSLVNCESWTYNVQDPKSVIQEWDLVCDRRWYISILYAVFGFGSLIAYGPSGLIADKFGRRPAMILGTIIVLFSCLGTSFAASIQMLIAAQFFSGAGYVFIQYIALTIFMESSGRQQRSYVAAIYSGMWGISIAIQAGISTILPSWRYFGLCLLIPTTLIILAMSIWFIPESPRWLLSVKKYSRAEVEIKKMAAINGKTINDDDSIMENLIRKVEMKKVSCENTSKGFFHSKRLIGHAGILLLLNVMNGFTFNGFSINIGHFGGNPKLNYIPYGLVGILSAGLYQLSTKCFKIRRIAFVLCFVTTGIAFFLAALIPSDHPWIKLSLAMVGKVFKDMSTAGLFIVASELFPTNLRGKGMAMYMVAMRIGIVSSSFTDLFVYNYGHNAAMLLFGSINFVQGVLVIFIPETQNKNLADSVLEAKIIVKKQDLTKFHEPRT